MSDYKEFRRLALKTEDAVEGAHMGHRTSASRG